jgi:hypothetical protein
MQLVYLQHFRTFIYGWNACLMTMAGSTLHGLGYIINTYYREARSNIFAPLWHKSFVVKAKYLKMHDRSACIISQ